MPPEDHQNSETSPNSRPEFSWEYMKTIRARLGYLFADMAACVRFFSRLPLPPVNSKDDPAAVPDFTAISRAAPLAGAVIALPAAGLGLLLGSTHLPTLIVALLVSAVLTIICGALHEDGLSDAADGFFGAAAIERRLEIMKDSRIGAFGALALVFSIALRIVLIAALIDRFQIADAILLFVSAEALSRCLMVWQWNSLPLARPDGLGARFGKPDDKALRNASGITVILLIPAIFSVPVAPLAAGLILAVLIAYGAGWLALAKIGGTTGDVLGAIQQLSGLGFLTGLLIVA